MHGGREELVPKYQISPVTHPVSARAPCVHYDYEAFSRHSIFVTLGNERNPRCPQGCPLDLLIALLLYNVGPDTSGRILSSSDMLRTEPGRDHQCMASM